MSSFGSISPANLSNFPSPSDITVSSVSPATALVEARGENGLLLPTSSGTNPTEAVSGTATLHISSLTGDHGALYVAGGVVISSGSSGLTIRSGFPMVASKLWDGATQPSVTFTVPAGTFLVALCSVGDWLASDEDVDENSTTPSLWTAVQTQNTAPGAVKIFTATAPGGGLTSETLTVQPSVHANAGILLSLYAFDSSSGAGVSNNATAGTGSPSVTLSGTTSGSIILAVVNDYAGISPTAASGITIDYNNPYPGVDYILRKTDPSTGGSVTMSCTSTGSNWDIAAIEVKAA